MLCCSRSWAVWKMSWHWANTRETGSWESVDKRTNTEGKKGREMGLQRGIVESELSDSFRKQGIQTRARTASLFAEQLLCLPLARGSAGTAATTNKELRGCVRHRREAWVYVLGGLTYFQHTNSAQVPSGVGGSMWERNWGRLYWRVTAAVQRSLPGHGPKHNSCFMVLVRSLALVRSQAGCFARLTPRGASFSYCFQYTYSSGSQPK